MGEALSLAVVSSPKQRDHGVEMSRGVVRRTWIKAARPDLCALRYAQADPDLRVTLSDPVVAAPTFRDLSAASFGMRTAKSSAWTCEAGKVMGWRALGLPHAW
jgi:hypothetical protein